MFFIFRSSPPLISRVVSTQHCFKQAAKYEKKKN